LKENIEDEEQIHKSKDRIETKTVVP